MKKWYTNGKEGEGLSGNYLLIGKERVKSGMDDFVVEYPYFFRRSESVLQYVTDSEMISVYYFEVKTQKSQKTTSTFSKKIWKRC